MLENKYINAEDLEEAKKRPMRIMHGATSGREAPYFVDMVKDHLLDKYSENELLSQNFRVYTTLDPALERDAVSAVEAGMKNVDTLLAKRYDKWKRELAKKGSDEPVPQVQVALVALDPRNGEIKAVVGGRDYGWSQLNHALAHRQPGSVFKPFVYAAAFDNAVDSVQPIITPATTIDDEPTTFEFDGKPYTPNNYGEKFMGRVTVRDALTNSLNVATVKVAELIGYGRVVQVARQMGLGTNIQPTPAVALGAYEMTPVDVAAGYTAFATMGMRSEPQFIRSVVNSDGEVLEKFTPQTHSVLDPRVAFLVDSLLKDVLNRGTGAAVRAHGFTLPAAGKTGTSRDGWFAGFTSNLLCVIWIGFDDNRDLGITGGAADAPIWADFMTKATSISPYRDVKDFSMPDGVQSVVIDPESLQLATPNCPTTREEVYVAGSAPTDFCELHGGHGTVTSTGSVLSQIFGGQPKTPDANGQVVMKSHPNRPPNPTQSSTIVVRPNLTEEQMADLYMARKEYREASQLYKRLAEQNPQNAVYLNKLGISLHQQAALGPALKFYERAVKVDPTYADAANNIGTIYYQRKKYSKAIKAYHKAIAIRNDMPVLYSNLAYAYFEDKKFEQAIASFRQALALDPQLFERNSSRNGSILQDRTVGDRGKFYFLLAKSFAEAGNLDRCLVYLRKAKDEGYKELAAIKMDPSFAAVIQNPAIQEILAPRPEDNPQI